MTLSSDFPAEPTADENWLSLLDWRRQVAALYHQVRELRASDPAAAHAVWQAERNRLFAAHAQSPLTPAARSRFGGLPVWPYDPALAFTAKTEIDRPSERFGSVTSAGHALPMVRFGRVRLPIGTLDVYWADVYGGGLFLPFRDATSGRESYGGGRYLLDTVKSADLGSLPGGELILDFNFAYHPSCFYDSRWSCPLALPSNQLSGPVRAGERVETGTETS